MPEPTPYHLAEQKSQPCWKDWRITLISKIQSIHPIIHHGNPSIKKIKVKTMNLAEQKIATMMEGLADYPDFQNPVHPSYNPSWQSFNQENQG